MPDKFLCEECYGRGAIRSTEGKPITCPTCKGSGVTPDAGPTPGTGGDTGE